MVKKRRRVFDVEMPENETQGTMEGSPADDTPPIIFPTGKPEREEPAATPVSHRRGPMATAIGETAVSARERQEIEARIRAENDSLAHEHVRLRRLGLVLDQVPLQRIDTTKLVRDRKLGPDPELEDLKASILSIGLSNPIRLEEAGQGRFELIQGFRRFSAYKSLLEETGDAEAWGVIPAAVAPQGEGMETLYRQMVDENLVRKDVSFYEMAQLALDYAADPATQESDPDRAVALLFKSARYQKRSYIRSFIKVAQRMGPILAYPEEMPRAVGLALAQRIDEDDGTVARIADELSGWDGRSIADELSVVRRHLGMGGAGQGDADPVSRSIVERGGGGKAKTSFQLDRREGRAKCTAADGRLEIRLSRDFTTIDRRRLEEAVQRMLDQLD